jgi:hypothetical protein
MTPITEAHGLSKRLSAQREKVRFLSGDTECAAWHYPRTELSFLRRHLLDHPTRPPGASSGRQPRGR